MTPNEQAQYVEAAMARVAAQEERKGNPVVHPRDNPNAKRWLDLIAKDEILETPGDSKGSLSNLQEAVGKFLESPQFLNWKARGCQGRTTDFEVEGKLIDQSRRARAFHEKTVQVGTVGDIRNVIATDYKPGVTPQGVREFRMRDLFTILPTEAGAIHYLRETGFTNNAGTLPENTDPDSVTSYSASRITITQESTTIRKIGHYIEFPRELMDDAPLLRAYIEARMENGIDDEEDDQLLHGSGAGTDILGIFNDPEVAQWTWSTDGDSGDNRADAFLLASLAIKNAKYMATGIGMSHTDWAFIIKLKDADGNYLFPQAHFVNAPKSLWGLPVVTSDAFTYGQGLVGAMGNPGAAYIADRQQTVVRMHDQHASRAIQGILTMVLDKRLSLVIPRPESFRQVSLNAAPSGSES